MAHGPTQGSFSQLLAAAIDRRRDVIASGVTDAMRLFGGEADGLAGVYVDRFGPGAAMITYEGQAPASFDVAGAASAILAATGELGVRAVYHKHFVRDRTKLGGEMPEESTDPRPCAGEPLPEAVTISEYGMKLEVRLYDGLSLGLFLDQRENRLAIRRMAERARAARAAAGNSQPLHVLNTFAYTGAFSVAAALGGVVTASVDVSARYLDWARRNFALNGLEVADHRFARMDTFEFLGYARRKGLVFDLVILDPPSFAAGNKRRGIAAWSSTEHYAKLVGAAAGVLAPGGRIFASTNTGELCRAGRLEREIRKGLGREPRWLGLPSIPKDFAGERGRFAARLFEP